MVEGEFKPSSDTATHLILYRAFPKIGGVVHTHSLYATAWAQACQGIPSYGTTQADYWYGDVPCTRLLKPAEIKNDYEANTGHVIVETFKKINPMEHPAVLVASHGPFTWGTDVADAVHNAGVLEFVARLASETLRINPKTKPMQSVLLQKHFLRKHGPNATYGQTTTQPKVNDKTPRYDQSNTSVSQAPYARLVSRVVPRRKAHPKKSSPSARPRTGSRSICIRCEIQRAAKRAS